MTSAHVGYITKFPWGQRRPPGNSEIEQSILPRYLNPFKISHSIPDQFNTSRRRVTQPSRPSHVPPHQRIPLLARMNDVEDRIRHIATLDPVVRQ